MDALALPDTGVLVALCIAAAMAGWVDAVSGGGGLLQLPALLVAFPSAEPVEALGTNKVSSVLGTAAATATYASQKRPLAVPVLSPKNRKPRPTAQIIAEYSNGATKLGGAMR